MTTTTTNNRQPYTIVSGEGENGTITLLNLTPTGLKRRVTVERCGGDRWCHAYHGHPAKGQGPRDLQPVE